VALVRSGANGYCPTERANVKSQLGAVIRERHLLPRFRLEEPPAKITVADERVTSTAKAGGDPAALRGLPAVGVRGAGGAIRGTKPGSNL
jgi:hypothetical protein